MATTNYAPRNDDCVSIFMFNKSNINIFSLLIRCSSFLFFLPGYFVLWVLPKSPQKGFLINYADFVSQIYICIYIYVSMFLFSGAFLVPYILMVFVIGLPLFFAELFVGQYSGLGPTKAYQRLAPFFHGKYNICNREMVLDVNKEPERI